MNRIVEKFLDRIDDYSHNKMCNDIDYDLRLEIEYIIDRGIYTKLIRQLNNNIEDSIS